MNESGVDYFCVGVALHCFLFCFFWRGNIKKYPQGILILFPIKTITTALLLSYKDIFHIQAHLRQ